jgi:ribonuclease HII
MTARQLELSLGTKDGKLSPAEDVDDLLRYEASLWRGGHTRVAGVDEVGVGPLAGPVVAAAVILPPWTRIEGVTDSKLLNAETRERLSVEIRKVATGLTIGVAAVEEVDQLNVYHAAILAMRRAVEALPLPPQHLLVDARTIRDTRIPQTSLTKGDRASLSIASASIIAKTHRDALMTELADQYPAYGFEQHKGYPTQAHQQAIQQFGPSPVHRKSFAFIEELTGKFSELFYSLRTSISEASTQGTLLQAAKRYRSCKALLSASERRKLTLLLRRREKQLAISKP